MGELSGTGVHYHADIALFGGREREELPSEHRNRVESDARFLMEELLSDSRIWFQVLL